MILNKVDKMFKDLIKDILDNGFWSENARPRYKSDGAVANSIYLTDVKLKFDLSKGEFPITQLRPIAIKSGIKEMLWIWQKKTSDLSVAHDMGIKWWDDWAMENNTIGQRYGATVNRYDILDGVIKKLEQNPFNRRCIMNLWQYADLSETAPLDPCAYEMVFDVRKKEGVMYLDARLSQRSSDLLIAGHLNMMQYVALQMMVAKHFGWRVGTFSWNVMNVHIYDRFIPQAKELLNREPKDTPPRLILNVPDGTNYKDIKAEDFELVDYEPVKPQLKFDIAL